MFENGLVGVGTLTATTEGKNAMLQITDMAASTLDGAVLDAKPTEEGTEFFIRAQSANGS